MAALLAERAGGGGFARRMAPCLTVLCTRFLRFDAADPDWPDRDRLVLSAPDGEALVDAMLTLTGQKDEAGLSLGSQPEQLSPGAGAAAQGVALAAGIALGERMLAGRFGRSLVDHRSWVLCRAAELGSGLALEAAALAGRQKLDKLVVLADAAADGPDAIEDEEALRCLPALGWGLRLVDAQDAEDIEAALNWALRARKPTLIACRGTAPSRLGAQAPSRLGAQVGLSRLGAPNPAPNIALAEAAWDACGHRGAAGRRAWLKRQVKHPLRTEFDRMLSGRLPEMWAQTASALRLRVAASFGQAGAAEAGRAMLAALSDALPELACCGIAAEGIGGASRQVACGARERGAAFLVAGLALHGGSMPCGLAPLAAADAVRPALRVIARSGRRAVQVLIEDGAVGGVEQLASLRAMQGLRLMRPGDPVELAECFELALRSGAMPTALVLPAQPMPVLRADGAQSRAARGGYVLAEAAGARAATLLATGTELRLALRLRLALARLDLPVAVISLPCWSLFAQQSRHYRDDVLGDAPRFGLEASSGFGWERWLGPDGHFLGAWTPGGEDRPEAVDAIAQQLARRLSA